MQNKHSALSTPNRRISSLRLADMGRKSHNLTGGPVPVRRGAGDTEQEVREAYDMLHVVLAAKARVLEAEHSGVAFQVQDLLSADKVQAKAGADKHTLLHEAVLHSSAVARLALEAGCDVNVRDTTDATPLHWLCRYHDSARSDGQDFLAAMTLLLGWKGIAVDAKDANGYTPLMLAVDQVAVGAVKLLLAAGADPNARSLSGMSPLLISVWHGSFQMAEQLFQCGAAVDVAADDGLSPLMVAVLKDDLDLVVFLVKSGARVDYETKAGKAAGLAKSAVVLNFLKDSAHYQNHKGKRKQAAYARNVQNPRGLSTGSGAEAGGVAPIPIVDMLRISGNKGAGSGLSASASPASSFIVSGTLRPDDVGSFRSSAPSIIPVALPTISESTESIAAVAPDRPVSESPPVPSPNMTNAARGGSGGGGGGISGDAVGTPSFRRAGSTLHGNSAGMSSSAEAVKVYTSENYPLDLEYFEHPILGSAQLGMSMCPGRNKKKKTHIWKRDLQTDLQVIQRSGAQVLLTLVKSSELLSMDIMEIFVRAKQLGLETVHFPVPDKWIPDSMTQVIELVRKLLVWVKAGRKIAIHCNGGKGRTGMVVVATLYALGLPVDEAIHAVRKRRKGMIRNPAQIVYLKLFETRWKNENPSWTPWSPVADTAVVDRLLEEEEHWERKHNKNGAVGVVTLRSFRAKGLPAGMAQVRAVSVSGQRPRDRPDATVYEDFGGAFSVVDDEEIGASSWQNVVSFVVSDIHAWYCVLEVVVDKALFGIVLVDWKSSTDTKLAANPHLMILPILHPDTKAVIATFRCCWSLH